MAEIHPNRLIFPQTRITIKLNAMKVGDSNASFGLGSNLKTAWIGFSCQGYNLGQYSPQGHGAHKLSPPRKGSNNNRGGFFCMALSLPHGSPYVSSCLILCLLLSLGHSHLINLATGSLYS